MFLLYIPKTDLTQGLYPTLIIILVSMQMSPVEHYSTRSVEMQFARVPAHGPAMASSTPRHAVTIHCEYTSDFDKQFPSLMKSSDEENSLLE